MTLTLRHPVRFDQERRKALDQRRYRSGEFAKKTGVSVRTLRYYHAVGLLAPAQRTEGGYRLYSDKDLARLQQILALRFLGLSLEEIRAALPATPGTLHAALAQQKAMLREWRTRLNTVLRAVEEAERVLATDYCDWDAVIQVIRAIQMEQDRDWTRRYFTPEQQAALQEAREQSYSTEAKQRLAEIHGSRVWTEKDQQGVDARYAALYAGVRRLVAGGAAPDSPEARSLATDALQLIYEFTRGDPAVTDALGKMRTAMFALPAEKRPPATPLTEDEMAFLERAKELARPAWRPKEV